MNRNQRKLYKALRGLPCVTPLQVEMACIILICNGIEAALGYVSDLILAIPDRAVIPPEAAEYIYLDRMADD